MEVNLLPDPLVLSGQDGVYWSIVYKVTSDSDNIQGPKIDSSLYSAEYLKCPHKCGIKCKY